MGECLQGNSVALLPFRLPQLKDIKSSAPMTLGANVRLAQWTESRFLVSRLPLRDWALLDIFFLSVMSLIYA